ncbi:MAG: PD-(D/E)XK nuclease family protein [Actinobacteria bacterium]|nr:PD-(D/E)XK nuclease family protein [Actinomycetota bacterium]
MGVDPPPSLSPSAIASFTQCPLAFKYSYVHRLPEPPSPWTSKGTLVHRALERLLDRPAPERTVAHALADLGAATADLAGHPEFTGLTLTDAEWERFHADAERLVRRYFELEDPTTVTPVGLELKLEARVGGVRVRGVIDRLELDADGELVITDYKTGSVPGERFEAKSLAGVQMYALLCEQTFGRRPARVQLYYLSKPQAIVATPTDQVLTGVTRRTVAIRTAIDGACARDDFRPSPSRLCDFCAFVAFCPAHGGDPAAAEEVAATIGR